MGIREQDVEFGEGYKHKDDEQQALLPSSIPVESSESSLTQSRSCCSKRSFTLTQLVAAFVTGSLACIAVQFAASVCSPSSSTRTTSGDSVNVLAPPYVGSTQVHNWPPPSPTNDYPTLFPTNVGHAGVTPTGAEAALIATAPSYPIHTGAPQLVAPASLHPGGTSKGSNKSFDIFKSWGNLSPWYSVEKGAFGVDSGPEAPEGCSVTGLHFLHRHGARYPTSWGALQLLYARLCMY